MIVRGRIERRRLLCPIYLADLDDEGATLTELRDLLDTGATRTLVTAQAARMAGLTLEGSISTFAG